MIIAATGHRKVSRTVEELHEFAVQQLRLAAPTHVISGVAEGWDEAVATAAKELGIPYTAAVPFNGYGKLHWPENRKWTFHNLLVQAAEIVTVCDYPGTKALDARNRWMVDRADRMLALWGGGFGGTFNCLTYAAKRGVPVHNCWPALEDPEILV